MKNQLTLLYFDSAEHLLQSIGSIQQHGIDIQEIYSAKPINGIEVKLRIKQLKFGNAVFRYGCLGGIALTSIIYYLMQPAINPEAGICNALLLLAAFLFADRLFPNRVPKLFTLKPGDNRYMMIVNARHTPVNETIAHLFEYTSAVNLSRTIKNIVIS
jgi:hypothetical protein